MNILIVNDDGITSRGLRELVDALRPHANIYVCAPDGQHSGASQSLTLTEPIRVYDFDYPGAEAAYAVTGTPTDCTKVGLQFYHERGIDMDMVYSGINIGSNFGKDTLYSGTIGAAMEAALSNVRAVAVSVDSHSATHFEVACEVAAAVIDKSMNELTPDTILNINAPDLPPGGRAGHRHSRRPLRHRPRCPMDSESGGIPFPGKGHSLCRGKSPKPHCPHPQGRKCMLFGQGCFILGESFLSLQAKSAMVRNHHITHSRLGGLRTASCPCFFPYMK